MRVTCSTFPDAALTCLHDALELALTRGTGTGRHPGERSGRGEGHASNARSPAVTADPDRNTHSLKLGGGGPERQPWAHGVGRGAPAGCPDQSGVPIPAH